MNTTELAAQVVSSLARESHSASGELYERIIERIHRYFRRLIRDQVEAEECLQETLMLLQQSLQQQKYDPSRSFNTWMWLKARSVYAKWCQARSRRPQALPPAVGDEGAGQRRVEEHLDALSVLDVLSERLGAEACEAFVLYYEGGLTQEEIAEVLGRSSRTVRTRLNEARLLTEKLLKK